MFKSNVNMLKANANLKFGLPVRRDKGGKPFPHEARAEFVANTDYDHVHRLVARTREGDGFEIVHSKDPYDSGDVGKVVSDDWGDPKKKRIVPGSLKKPKRY